MSQQLLKRTTIVGLVIVFFTGASFLHSQLIRSANLTSVSVTLSNPRLSFRGALTSGNTVGSSIVTINTTAGSYPSTSSAQLVEGDTLRIGSGGTLGSYTVASTSSLSTLTLTAALASGQADSGDDVISTQSATHTVRFTTANAIANGRFRILVPSLADNTAAADGIADGGFFDFGTSTPTVTCPSNANSTYDFVTGVATASSITIGATDYHVFECAYSGSGAVGTAFDASSNDAITISSLINPAPKSTHTTGNADTYNVVVQHLDSNLSILDSTTVGIGVIEAVKVTASVPPQITFQILGLAAGTSACGVNTGVTTTAASVPFGELSVSAFTNAAQALAVSTNATGGYTVTALANDQLGRNGGACTGDPTTDANCIRDTAGNGGAMTHSASAEWTNTSAKGFGYSLHNVNATGLTPAFLYTTASGNCSGTYCARQFADQENSQTAQTIFNHTSVADNHNLYVCYRIVPDVTTAAGNYENYIIYTATATF